MNVKVKSNYSTFNHILVYATGPYCEQEKKFCLTRPPVPQNSKMSCSSTSCAISCAKGYTFPDGSSITNMICKDGQWASSRANQTSIPNCERKFFNSLE